MSKEAIWRACHMLARQDSHAITVCTTTRWATIELLKSCIAAGISKDAFTTNVAVEVCTIERCIQKSLALQFNRVSTTTATVSSQCHAWAPGIILGFSLN